MKPRWDGMLAGRDEAGRSLKAFLGLSERTGPVFKRGQVVMQEPEAEVFDPLDPRWGQLPLWLRDQLLVDQSKGRMLENVRR